MISLYVVGILAILGYFLLSKIYNKAGNVGGKYVSFAIILYIVCVIVMAHF